MWKFSLKRKIILVIISSCLFMCLILGLVIFWYLNKNLTDQRIDEILKLNVEQVHESTQIFEKDRIFTKMLGTRTRVKEFLLDRTEARRVELLGIFSDYAKEDTKYLAIYLLDKNGVGLISTDSRFVGQDYSFRDYFKKALEGIPVVDVSIGKTSNQFGYYFSYPVKDNNGSVIGVLVVKIDNKEIDEAILNSEVSKNSTTMLVDKYGIVLVSNEKERFLKSLGEITSDNKEIIKNTDRLLGKEIISLQYDNAQKVVDNYNVPEVVKFYDPVDKETENISIVKLSDLPFFLVTEIGLESVQSLVFLTIVIIILIIILGILLFSFVIYKFIAVFINPIKKFELLSDSISKGDFSKKIDIKTRDEFGNLAIVFNHMVENLNDLYKNLDKKVEEKTKEIGIKTKETEDQKSAILNILEDVEKEKNKAEELSAIVRDANEPIISKTIDGIILSWNKGAENLYGYTEEEMIGKSIKIIVPEEKYQEVDNLMKKVFLGDKVEHYQTTRKKKDGSLVDVSLSASPIRDSFGKIIAVSVISLDITKEKEIDKAKTEFVSLASHQLRTPLSSINWYTEMLLAGDAGTINEEQKKYLNEVAIGNKRMVELVDALLNVSRLDLGTFIIEPEPTDVVEMAHSVVNEMKPQIISKNIKLEEFYDEHLSKFQADKKLLRIVFQNLLSNAVKYTPNDGSVKIKVAILKKGEIFGDKTLEGESLSFSISDTGMGIPINQQEKVFSKLFRADNARESESEGTGLGLYIIKSIVDQSGGVIWFKSEENKGTTFYVFFPLSGMKKKEGTKKLD